MERAEMMLMVIAVTMAFLAVLVVGPGLKWFYPVQHGEMLMLFKNHPATQNVIGNADELNLIQFWQLKKLVDEGTKLS
jgi:hypothetical protein